MTRLHIVGCPRSGTTLLHELARTCLDVAGACPHEQSVFDEPPRVGGDGVYVTKQPRDERVLAPILDADPDLIAVGLTRDPRAVVASVHMKVPGMYFTNLRTWLECDDAQAKLRGHSRFLAVRYEDLVADPDATQRALVARFGALRATRPFSEFERHAQAAPDAAAALGGVRAIRGDRVGAWRAHLPRVRAEFDRRPEAFDRLVAHGYEPDRAWFAALDGVAPDAGRCRVPDELPVWMRWDWRARMWLKTRRAVRAARARQRSRAHSTSSS